MKTTFVNEMAPAFTKTYETIIGLLPENLIPIMSFDVFDNFIYIGINVYRYSVTTDNAVMSESIYIYEDEIDKAKEFLKSIIKGVKEIDTDEKEDENTSKIANENDII